MYILNICIDGKLTTKIIEDFNAEDLESGNLEELGQLLNVSKCAEKAHNEEHNHNTAMCISAELFALITQAIKDKSDLTDITADYELTDYEIEFISKLMGNITNYAHLLEFVDNCGKTEPKNAGFWLKNSEQKWVAVEHFCDKDIVMGYVKPAEIMQYLLRLERYA